MHYAHTTMANMHPDQSIDPYRNGLTSGSDNPWEPLLGPLDKPYDINPLSKRPTSRWVMPAAYEGRNEWVANTIEDLWVTARYTWMTEYIFPWYKTEEIHMVWTRFELNPAYMSITPHTTSSRTITSQRTVQRASIVRRGIRAEVEDDFIRTEQGRETLAATYMQMARTVQDTANAEGMRQLVNCHRSTQAYNRKHTPVTDADLDAYLERDVERFMIAQKTTNGLEILDVQVNEALENYNDIRDKQMVWIFSPEVFNYTSTVKPEKTFFFLGGQEAVDRLNGRPGTRNASAGTQGVMKNLSVERMVADTPVFIAKGREYMGLGGANLMQRTREVGVYNLMIDRTRDYANAETAGLALRVYDNDIDAWSEISYEKAIMGCGVFNDDGDLIDPFGRGGGKNLIDDEFDWLSTKKGDKRVNIKHLGDTNTKFVSASQWLNYAKTALKAFETVDIFKAFLSKQEEVAGAIRVAPGEDTNSLGPFEPAAARKARKAREAPAAGKQTDPENDPGVVDNNNNAQIHTQFLTDILGAAVKKSAEHKAQVQQIASREVVPWKQRAEQIKTYLNDVRINSPVEMNSRLHDETAFKEWYTTRIEAHESELQEQAVNIEASVPKATPRQVPAKPRTFFETPEFLAHAAAQRGNARGGSGGGGTRGRERFRIGGHLIAPGARGGLGDRAELAAQDNAGSSELDSANTEIYAKTAVGFVQMAYHWDEIAKLGGDSPETEMAQAMLLIPVHRKVLVNLARRNVFFGWGFALFRPHATYTTLYGIKCAANGQTGRMVYGHGNMQVGHDVSRKTSTLHYTTYLSAVVLDDRNVYVVEDIFCKRYKGGMGVEMWTAEKYKAASNRRSRSIICAPLPPSFDKMERKIDIRGFWYTHQAMGLVSDERFDKPLYPGAARINHLFDLHGGARSDRQQTRSKVKINFVCYQGHEWYFNTKTHQWDNYTVEQGHFGPKVYEGCGKVRNGYMQYLEDPHYNRNGK